VLRFVASFAEHDFGAYEIRDVEKVFDVPVIVDGRTWPRARYVGRIDVVLRERSTGDLLLADHKFVAGDASTYDLKFEQDPQLPGYVYAQRALGRQPSGRVLFNIVRKKGMSEICVNMNGELRSAAVDTTRALYEEALVRQETQGFAGQARDGTPTVPVPRPRTDKQIARLEQLPTSTRKWAARHEHVYSPDEIDRWVREFAGDVTSLRRFEKPTTFLARNGSSCTAPGAMPCAYRSICTHDTPERRAQFFDVVGERHVELVDEEVESAR